MNNSRFESRLAGDSTTEGCRFLAIGEFRSRIPVWIVLSLMLTVMGIAVSAQTNEWTWMGGSNTLSCSYGFCSSPGNYGSVGVPAAGNIPSGRYGASQWTDSNGNFWLFGGGGNDLWQFNPTTQEWEWASGGSTSGCPFGDCSTPGVYGSLGVPAAANGPGARSNALSWADMSGNLWLFGGVGYDANGGYGTLNDFWKFNPTIAEWTWMGGSSALTVCGIAVNTMTPIYCPLSGWWGTMGEAAPENQPGAQRGSVTWVDKTGSFWFFGGGGFVEPGGVALVNELWKFDPSIGEWAWMGGCSHTPDSPDCPNQGVYGTLGVAAADNIPGSRTGAAGWTDANGNLWLFGGQGYDSAGQQGELNDLWEFNLSNNKWAWMGGSSAVICNQDNSGKTSCVGQPGVYGSLGVPAAANVPGGRDSAMSWTDQQGNLWLFGGEGPASENNTSYLNDLWVFNPYALIWTWMGGSNTGTCSTFVSTTTCGNAGSYGTLGAPAGTNVPGSRESAVEWTDSNGQLWLWGGNGYDSTGTGGFYASLLNDLWVYDPSAPVVPAAIPSFSVASGSYTSVQSVTIADVTPNATIYFTTDGSTPTTSSTVYSAAIAVAASETVNAIAVANGYSTSAVASATYTINLPPPTFTFAVTPTSLTMSSGGTGKTTLTVTPQNGFNAMVSFACSGLPAGATCTFSPSTVTAAGSAASTTLMITAPAQAAVQTSRRLGLSLTVVALSLGWFGGWFGFRRRCGGLLWVVLLAIGVAAGLASGCGGGSNGGGNGGGGRSTSVTSTVTVTAMSGSLQRTATITVTVN